MANSPSAEKRIRQNEKARRRNKEVRSLIRTRINQFEEAAESGDLERAEEALRDVESQLDRAVSKGVIPKNRASRKTGRLAKRLNALREDAS